MREQLVLFYQKDFYRIKQLHPRHKLQTIALLLNKEIQLAAILLSDSQSRGFLKTTFQVIDLAKIYPIVCWEKENEVCLTFFMISIIVIMMIVMVLLYLFLFHRNLFFRAQQEINSNEVPQNSKQKSILQIPLAKYRKSQDESNTGGEQSYFFFLLQKLFAAFVQTYQYIFFQPSFYLLSKNLISGIEEAKYSINGVIIFQIATGVLLLPLLVMLYIFTELHKASFRFNDPDQMGMFSNKHNFYFSLMNLALIVVKIIAETLKIPLATTILAGIYYLLLYWIGSLFHYQLNFEIQQMRNQLNAQLGLLYILLSVQEWNSLKDADLLLYYLFFGPLLSLISYQIFSTIERKIIFFQRNQSCDGVILDWQLRFIYWHSQQVFLKKRERFNKTKTQIISSLLIYNIMSNHVYQCNGVSKLSTKEASCFCLEYFPDSNSKNSKAAWDKYIKRQNSDDEESASSQMQTKLTEKEFQHFIFDYIKNEYEFYLKKRKMVKIEISLSYIYFIVEVLKIPTKAFYETLNLYKSFSINSLKNKKLIFQLLTTSKNQFNELVIRKDIKNQKYNHQVCFLLDKSITIVMQNILTTVTQLKAWLEILINQKGDHQVIYNEGQEIVANINAIETQLNQMFIANPLSSEIETLYAFYFKYLNLHQKRNSLYKKNSKIANEFLTSYNRVAFNKDSCIVGISFLHPIGRVVRYTNNFAQFCGISDKSELNSANINRFMPDLLARSHDQYLHNFIEKGRMNIVNSDQRFILIKTKEEFVIPIIAKIKLEDAYDDDFGASAILIKVNTPYHYLLLNKYCLLEEISKSIFQVFRSLLKCTIFQMKALDFLLLIPQLLTHWKQYSEEENDEDGFFRRNSSQFINVQNEFDVSLILPRGQDLIEYLLKRKPVIKKNASKYFQHHLNHLQAYFKKLLDFDLFTLKVKVIPVVTLYENVYILEVQSIKQFKKMPLEEKLDKVKTILNQVFPFQFSNSDIKQEDSNLVDIANLEEFIALEEDQMGDAISQNLSKILHTNTASNQMKQFSFPNDNQRVGTLGMISTPELPNFPIVNQTNNILTKQYIQNSISDDYTENSSPENQQVNHQNDNIDQHSISSAVKYSEQFAKRGLIRQVIFDKQVQINQIWLTLFRFGFLGLLLLCTIIFSLLVILNQNVLNHNNQGNIGGFSELFDEFFIYKQCQQEVIDCKLQNEKILFKFSSSLKNLTNYFSKPIDFIPCIQQGTDTPILEYEIAFLYNFMHNGIDEQQLFLVEHYYCFKEIFKTIDLRLQHQYTNGIVKDEEILNICFIVGVIFILILCFLLVPFELFQEKQKNQIMRLFQTLNKQHLIGQFQILQQIAEYNQKSDLTSKEFLFEDVLDSSKSKYECMETKHFVKPNSIIKHLNNQGNTTAKFQVFNKNIKKIPIKIFALLLLMLILQSYFSLSYLLYNKDQEIIDGNIQQLLSFFNFSSKFMQMGGQTSIVTNVKFYSNQTILNQCTHIFYTKVVNQMTVQPLNNQMTQIWQSSIKELSEDSNLSSFITTDFCEIFQSISQADSNFNFEICTGIPSLHSGFILIITSISDFYDDIVNILNLDEQQSKLGSTEIQSAYPIVQLKTLFAIQALDYLKVKLMELNQDTKLYLHIIVFIFYTLLLGLIYIYGLFYVRVQIFQSLEKAKRLLSLIPMETLLENAHVQSFVQKEQLKKKF